MSTKTKEPMTIGVLAKKAKINLQTIRYYESLNLLPDPKRTEAGYRIYDDSYLPHIQFVKNAQDLGFTLDEIKKLVRLKANRKAMGKDVKAFIEKKMLEVDNNIAILKETKIYLESLNKSCSGKMPTSCCPIVKDLSSKAQISGLQRSKKQGLKG